ncbi:MAG TPA: hypothetical protein PK228_08165, partial [Saprospiraceae bacterium]|nr:hypothetical protein [Saprospiraceae bacterium]
MKTTSALTCCLLLALGAGAQKQILCDTCPCLLEQARLNAAKDKNGEAISLYQAYLVCEPTKVADVTAEIKAIQQKTERQKDLERQGKMLEKKLRGEADSQRKIAETRAAKSRRDARAGHNLAITLRTLQTDPTLAARMAEMSLKEHTDDAVTQQVFADILSNPDNYFYRLQEFAGHQQGIARMVVSSGGQYVATAGYDPIVKLWRHDGRLMCTFDSLPSQASNVQFSNDGMHLLFYGNNWVMVGDTSGKILSSARLRQNNNYALFMQAAISPDGNSWVWLNENGQIILQCTDGQQFDSLDMGENRVSKLVFSPDNTHLLVCGSTDTTTLLWNIPRKKRILLRGHANGVYNGFFSPDGNKVATVNQQGVLRVWSLQGDSLGCYESPSKRIKDAFFVNKDSLLLQTTGQTVALWSGGSQNLRPFNNLGNLELLSYPAGSRLLMLGISNTEAQKEIAVRIYNRDGVYRTRFGVSGENMIPKWAGETPEGDIILYFLNRNARTFRSYRFSNRRAITFSRRKTATSDSQYIENAVYKTAFSPDGKFFVYAHPYDSAAVVRQVNDPKSTPFRIQKVNCATLDVSINPNLSDTSRYFFLTLNSDNSASLWDKTARERLSSNDPNCPVVKAQFFPDGNRVLLTCADSTFRLWNPADNQRQPIGNYPKTLFNAIISPDGSMIAIAGRDRRIYVWSAAQQSEKAVLPDMENPIRKMYFLPDSHRLLAQTEAGEIFLWDINQPEKPVKTWRGYWNNGDNNVIGWRDMALSPKGEKMLLISNGSDALLTDINGEKTVELSDVYAQSAAFSADETCMLTAGWDNIARLWNQEGQYLASFKGEQIGGILSTAISPDNSLALTMDEMGTTRLWKMPGTLLKDELHPYSTNDLAAKDILPDPAQLDSITHPKALYHTAFNFLNQQDSLTAYLLFDRLLRNFPNQGEEVWYHWYATGKSAGYDHLDSLMRQTRILYPLAERFKKEGKFAEAKKMYESLINKGERSIPLWDYFDLCKKGGYEVNKDIFLNETNSAKLASSAQYFYADRDIETARQLYLKSLQQGVNTDALIGLDKINNPADQLLIKEKTPLLTDFYELQRLANHFRTNGQVARAAALFEQALLIQEEPQAVIALYEINQQHPEIPFDPARFEQSQNQNAVRNYYWYFQDQGVESMKTKMLKRLIQLGTTDAYDYLDYYLSYPPEERPAIFDTLLHLQSPVLLKNLMNTFAEQAATMELRSERADYYEKATQIGERLLKLEDDPAYKTSLSQHYNSKGWNDLFIKEYEKCYEAILRGIELDPKNLYLYTNLPHALLLMGKKEIAWEAYKKYESTPYFPARQRPFIRNAYFFDFEDFRNDYKANPGEHFTEQMMKDINEMENRLKALPP